MLTIRVCYTVVPGDVEMVNLICAPVNLISQCYVTWNVCEYVHMIAMIVMYAYMLISCLCMCIYLLITYHSIILQHTYVYYYVFVTRHEKTGLIYIHKIHLFVLWYVRIFFTV